MLRLNETALLLTALQPPQGMSLDAAIGTTFTLDLTALLTIPVAASFDLLQGEHEPADLLETVRRYADRTILFCQAGAISVPARYRAAHTFVEDTVVEVRRPQGGLFHPKLWVVRFKAGQRYLHRVLVMSRNLTFDRSWDVMVRLDEDADARRTVETDGLLELLADLRGRAVRSLTGAQETLFSSVLSSIAGATLAVPEPFSSGKFVPCLPGVNRWPFRSRHDAVLAVSPFLGRGAVARFFKPNAGRKVIVSRQRALDAQVTALASTSVSEVYRLKDALLSAEDDLGTLDETSVLSGDPAVAHAALKGLHAKFYVQDHGARATVWLGSANLTDAALSTNVELLVEFTGPVKQVGVECVLARKGRKDDLSWLVERHDLPDTDGDDDEEEGLDPIEHLAYDIASSAFEILCEEHASGWTASLSVSGMPYASEVAVSARLLSLAKSRTTPVESGKAAWSSLAAEDLTPFVVITLSSQGAQRNVLVRAALHGDPDHRRRSVLARAIRSREDFLRYLAALLGYQTLGISGAGGGDGGPFDRWFNGIGVDRVLEDLLTTASRHPERLTSLGQTLDALGRDPEFGRIVPADFTQLWEAVYTSQKAAIR
ncbi:phospholipase D family protein [Stenotrophomonas sp. PS02289]|uniref:phospholipase D family protein n=1 Tax=Stenotrophomonas sp. PS02289 TaxID=2991422 RepID=UPI002499DAEF|nr:phospholipase D family protein [Stenotrophomonas sp. PS02289]